MSDPASIQAAAAAAEAAPVQAGHNASLTQIGDFQAAMQAAAQGGGDAFGPAVRGMVDTLQQINMRAQELGDIAQAASMSENEMTPGEMVMLTVRCHEFMFNCQLTSNIANRTSDGLQQLFRQQS
jgi:hypothetical protein